MADFDWNDMKYFLEVARLGTLSGAARVLGVDHATVGRRIGILEHALNRKLFQRSSVGYVLTPVGRDLLTTAEQMELNALRMALDAGEQASAIGGVVRLVTADGFGNFLLAEQLQKFCENYPRLTVQLVPMQQISAQMEREAEIYITLSPGGARFASEKLSDYHLGLYASQSYLHLKGEPRSREDLRQHRFVGYIQDLLFAHELDYLDEINPGLTAKIQCLNLLAQVEATRSGAGICVLPHYIARKFPDLVSVLPAHINIERSYWMNISNDLQQAPRVRALADFIRQQAQLWAL